MKKKAKKKIAPRSQKKAAKQKPAPTKKGPRQQALPGLEDRSIQALDDAALSYDEVKKARMKLTEQEVDAKTLVSELMHKAKKTHYKHGNIVIDLVPEGEKVKVKIKPEGEDDETPDDTEPAPDETTEESAGEEEATDEDFEEEARALLS